MLTDSMLGRCVFRRTSTAQDHRRFPSADVDGGVAAALPSDAAAPLAGSAHLHSVESLDASRTSWHHPSRSGR